MKKWLQNSISATLFALATVPGHLLGGCIADKWGRIQTIFIFNLISYVFWLATAFGNDRYLLYLTYALQGFFGSISYNVVSMYKIFYVQKLTKF